MSSNIESRFNFESGFLAYWNTFCLFLGLSFLCGFIEPAVGYRTIGFIFLAAVILVGSVSSLRTGVFASFLSALCWNYFFIPPRFTFYIATNEDRILCLTYFIAALVTGYQSRRSRLQAQRTAVDEWTTQGAPRNVRERASELRREPMSIYGIVGSVLRRLTVSFGAQSFSLEVESGLPVLRVDFVLIEQSILRVMDVFGETANTKNKISIKVYSEGGDVCFRIESSQTAVISETVLAKVDRVFTRHGGRALSTRRIDSGTLVQMTLPLALNT